MFITTSLLTVAMGGRLATPTHWIGLMRTATADTKCCS